MGWGFGRCIWEHANGLLRRHSRLAIDILIRHRFISTKSISVQLCKKNNIAREELFITTKIWNGNQPVKKLVPSFEESLKKLQTDYVDLLLLHFPVTETRRPAWKKMEEIYASGRAKAIGVSNYTVRHLEELLGECEVKPAVNQVELHVFLQQPELVAFCKKHDIVVEAYSPLAHGHGLNDKTLQALAAKHGKSTAQIMLRWCIQVGAVPLPKSTHAERIQENISVFDFELDASDMAAPQIARPQPTNLLGSDACAINLAGYDPRGYF